MFDDLETPQIIGHGIGIIILVVFILIGIGSLVFEEIDYNIPQIIGIGVGIIVVVFILIFIGSIIFTVIDDAKWKLKVRSSYVDIIISASALLILQSKKKEKMLDSKLDYIYDLLPILDEKKIKQKKQLLHDKLKKDKSYLDHEIDLLAIYFESRKNYSIKENFNISKEKIKIIKFLFELASIGGEVTSTENKIISSIAKKIKALEDFEKLQSKYFKCDNSSKTTSTTKDKSKKKKGEYTVCPYCGINLFIPIELVHENYIQCLTCYNNFPNPLKDNNEDGEWVECSKEEFMKAVRYNATRGDIEAQCDLGHFCFDDGNYSESAYWFHQAAMQGYSGAMIDLAYCYMEGFGVSLDKNSALYCYEKAIRNKDHLLTKEDITNLKMIISELKADGYSSSRANLNFGSETNASSSKSESNYSANSINNNYKILEINSTATNDEIKKAYYDQMAKYHPDKVNHLGEHLKKFAEDHCAKLNAAYDRIKKERGMN